MGWAGKVRHHLTFLGRCYGMAEEKGDPAAADERTARDRHLRDHVAFKRGPTKMR